jgi:HPt (histidine-containing phosphotransfer) domain-containing protein
MDCQMPDLDGLAATAAIRRREPAGGPRAVIAALTADVSTEQRTRCREAGMDDFLEKPVRTETLARLLGTHLGAAAAPSAPRVERAPAPPVDDAALLRLETDIGPGMTRDLVREYLDNAEQTLDRLTSAGAPDPARVRSEAHRLLGSARILGLAALERLWRTLADRPLHVDPFAPPATLAALRFACGEVRAWLDAHQGTPNA